jgi:hypothetical protein
MLIDKIAMAVLGVFFCLVLVFSLSTNRSISMDLITDIFILLIIAGAFSYFWDREKKTSKTP